MTVNTENGDIKNVGASVPALDALAIAGCPTTVSGAAPAAPSAVKDLTAPTLSLVSKARQSLKTLRGGGLKFTLKVSEASKLRVTLNGRLTKNGARGRSTRLARVTVNSASAGQLTVTLRPSSALRARLAQGEAPARPAADRGDRRGGQQDHADEDAQLPLTCEVICRSSRDVRGDRHDPPPLDPGNPL